MSLVLKDKPDPIGQYVDLIRTVYEELPPHGYTFEFYYILIKKSMTTKREKQGKQKMLTL